MVTGKALAHAGESGDINEHNRDIHFSSFERDSVGVALKLAADIFGDKLAELGLDGFKLFLKFDGLVKGFGAALEEVDGVEDHEADERGEADDGDLHDADFGLNLVVLGVDAEQSNGLTGS